MLARHGKTATKASAADEVGNALINSENLFFPFTGSRQKTILSSEGRGWTNIGAAQFRFDQERIAAPPPPSHVVMLCLSPVLDIEAKIGGKAFEKRVVAGESSILPAGIASAWLVRAENKQDSAGVLQMNLKPEFLARVADQCEITISRSPLAVRFSQMDEKTRAVGLMLLEELKETTAPSRYRADLLAELLAVHLLEIHGENAPHLESKGGLPPAKLRRVCRYIAENLDGNLELAELAETVEMNIFHFARMFKQATGFAPHQFVVGRRIARAKELLTETKMPLVEICLEVGIQSQNHFTTLFRRHTGHTPKKFRDRHF